MNKRSRVNEEDTLSGFRSVSDDRSGSNRVSADRGVHPYFKNWGMRSESEAGTAEANAPPPNLLLA